MWSTVQFYEVDLPQVSEKKIALVDAVIPDTERVGRPSHSPSLHTCRGKDRLHTVNLPMHSGFAHFVLF